MTYRISYTGAARKDVRRLPGNYRQRIRRLIEALPREPRPQNAKELRDMPNRYRIRVERWRVIYRVDDDDMQIIILRVRQKTGPETYRDIDAA